ncbi:hypothetical protein ANCDUO_08069 [Ancylostoma duodenale]|uniref:Uncharacterized protein n=1 Tax=Ancylostoma duodenale TaxID=51022 RepID=A0A0C2CXC5_9BILA|nr:hypothetical protein ANCDUO_08069 [Ancylostoma duodenale]
MLQKEEPSALAGTGPAGPSTRSGRTAPPHCSQTAKLYVQALIKFFDNGSLPSFVKRVIYDKDMKMGCKRECLSIM